MNKRIALRYAAAPFLCFFLLFSVSYAEGESTSDSNACDADFQRLIDQLAQLSDESLRSDSPPNSYAAVITSDSKLAVFESRVEADDSEEDKKRTVTRFMSSIREFSKKSEAIATAVSIPLEMEGTAPGANGIISLFLEHRSCDASAWAIPFYRKGTAAIEYGEMTAIPLSVSILHHK